MKMHSWTERARATSSASAVEREMHDCRSLPKAMTAPQKVMAKPEMLRRVVASPAQSESDHVEGRRRSKDSGAPKLFESMKKSDWCDWW